MKKPVLVVLAVVILLPVVAGGIGYWVFHGKRYTFSFTEEQIREQLQKRFPVEKSYLGILSVRYENPRVKLVEGASDIHVGTDAMLDVRINEQSLAGSADLVTQVGYDAGQGQFILYNPKLTKLRIDGVPEKYIQRVMDLGSKLAAQYLEKVPVYKLRPKDVKTALAHLVLKDVRVENGLLRITIGI